MPAMFFVMLPFIAAMCYGLGYVLIEKVVGVHVNMPTFFAINSMVCIPVLLFVMYVKSEPLDFKSISVSWQIFFLVLATASIPCLGWVFSIFAIRHTSALFTAFAETSYPLFTMAFGFLLFGIKQVNFPTLLGGFIILCGAMIMVYGQNIGQSDE